jgi:excisionase family DNA binding protein
MAKIRSIRQAAEYLKELDNGTGVTENAIRVMVKRGDIPAIKVGCKSLINIDKLIEFLEIQTTAIQPKEEKDEKYNMRKIY